MPKFSIIAIDGPAASGKSTLAFRLAAALGFLYFDTGLMYRAITWVAINRKLNVLDEIGVSRLAENVQIEVLPPSLSDGRPCDVVVEGRDITWEIRNPDVEANVSIVSAYPGVRRALTQQQRRIGLHGHVVMVGRDIGTVVLPEADLKIYLDASAAVRAQRRFSELIGRGMKVKYSEVLEKVIERDRIDTNRDIAPLIPAKDAVIIDSDNLDADKVFEKIFDLCND